MDPMALGPLQSSEAISGRRLAWVATARLRAAAAGVARPGVALLGPVGRLWGHVLTAWTRSDRGRVAVGQE